ncbi:MAG: AzlD domain-containing protein [Sporolactobacillus sp.]
MLKHWLLIAVLAVATHLSRVAGVEVMTGRRLSPTVRDYFGYVPIAIIAALLVKQIFIPSAGGLSVSFPVLAACLFTAIAIKTIKIFLASLLIGIAAGLLCRYLFGL